MLVNCLSFIFTSKRHNTFLYLHTNMKLFNMLNFKANKPHNKSLHCKRNVGYFIHFLQCPNLKVWAFAQNMWCFGVINSFDIFSVVWNYRWLCNVNCYIIIRNWTYFYDTWKSFLFRMAKILFKKSLKFLYIMILQYLSNLNKFFIHQNTVLTDVQFYYKSFY